MTNPIQAITAKVAALIKALNYSVREVPQCNVVELGMKARELCFGFWAILLLDVFLENI
jgi:hypothetical protein